jgi:YVTN family beta-propeller protein
MKLRHNNYKLTAALLMALGASSLSAHADDNKGVAYVSNQDGGVTVIDLATMETKGSLDIEAKGPRGIGITADGKWLVTANRDDGNISVIDTTTGKVAKHIAIGKNPEFVRVKGDMAYVSYEPDSKGGPPPKPGSPAAKEEDDDDKTPAKISVVDLKQGKVVHEVTGGPETEGIEFSKDGKKLVVTNEADNSITVHDIKSGKLLKTISTTKFGERPRGIKVSPDGSYYVSTLEFSNKILVLDKNFKPLKAVDTGKAPYGVSFDPEGKRLFVATSKENALQVFDAKTFEKIKDIPVGNRCWHFSFTPDSQNVLLACGKSDAVYVIDAQKLEVTKQIGDKEMPWGVVTYPKAIGSLDKP